MGASTAFKQDNEYVQWARHLFDNALFTDKLILSKEQAEDLFSLWNKTSVTVEDVNQTPSDILFADTVPLKSVKISLLGKETEIIVYPENLSEFDIEQDEVYTVGDMRITHDSRDSYIHSYYALLVSTRNPNCILPLPMGVGEYDVVDQIVGNDERVAHLISISNSALALWYSINICLLNPVTQVIFSKPTLVKLHGKEKITAQKYDKTIKYVKHYQIKDDDIANAIFGGKRTIHRKCLVWYVTGHWREYKSGKKVFIKGYFKGALRNTPTPDVIRNRELVINESEVKNEHK